MFQKVQLCFLIITIFVISYCQAYYFIQLPDNSNLNQQRRFVRSSVNFDDDVDRQPEPLVLIKTGSGRTSSGSAIKFSDDDEDNDNQQPVQTNRKGPGAFGEMIADQERSQLCGNNAKRYEPKSGECFKIGSVGPCGNNMIFYEDPDSNTNGVCDCIVSRPRTFIFHELTQQCYPIYQQAYCLKGQWLTLNSAGNPECQSNPCQAIQEKQPNREFVYFNSRCVELNKKQPECNKPKEVVTFVLDKIEPTCGIVEADYALGSLKQPCKAGTHRSRSGKCKQGWQWS